MENYWNYFDLEYIISTSCLSALQYMSWQQLSWILGYYLKTLENAVDLYHFKERQVYKTCFFTEGYFYFVIF